MKPFLAQTLSYFLSVSLFCPTHSATSRHKYWIYQTICKAKPVKFTINLYADHNTYGSNTLPANKLSLKSRFSVKVRQHGQQQLPLQYKVRWILYKLVGAPSLLQPYLCIQPMLQSPPKKVPLLQSIFTFLFHPYLLTKSSL